MIRLGCVVVYDNGLHEVVRVTKTQAVCDDGSKFFLKDCSRVGWKTSKDGDSRCILPTKKVKAAITRKAKIKGVKVVKVVTIKKSKVKKVIKRVTLPTVTIWGITLIATNLK